MCPATPPDLTYAGFVMVSYTFHFFANGKLLHKRDVTLRDDLDEVDMAQVLAAEGDVEVWAIDRFVARVKHNSVPLEASDAAGGSASRSL
jgi:hypothetical protein